MRSQVLNVVRYSNGTLIKIAASAYSFASYDYNPDDDSATFYPEQITITATASGGVKIGSWKYSTDGAHWYEIVSGEHGFTVDENVVTLVPSSDLYRTENSAITVGCYGDNDVYFDTVTIMRYVDPTFVYKQTSTAIEQTNSKISLIASEEQLAKYGTAFTVLDDVQSQIDLVPSKISLAVSNEHQVITDETNETLKQYATLETMESRLDITAQDITSSVSRTYQTKSDAVAALTEAKDYTDDAEQAAKNYADGKVSDVQVTLRSEIRQSADNITSTVSATYQTKSDAEDDLDEAKNYTDDAKATLRSEIQQTADSITSSISATYQTKSDAEDDLDEAKEYARNQDTTLRSQIKQTTDAISTEVSKKVGSNEIISKINQSAESIKINANKVNITGYVTFDNLEEDGQSVINGANITTGIIHDANNNTQIDLSTGKITTKKLVVDAANFKLTETGVMTCYGGNFYGNVYAGSGAKGIYLTDGRIYFSGGSSASAWINSANIELSGTAIRFNSASMQGIGMDVLRGNLFVAGGIGVGTTSAVLDISSGNVWTKDLFRLSAGVAVRTSLGTGQTFSNQKLLTGMETQTTAVVTGYPTIDSLATNVLTGLSGASTSNVLYGGTLVQVKIPDGVKLNYRGEPELTYPYNMPYGGYYVFSAKPSQKTFWLPSNAPSHTSKYLIASGKFTTSNITHYKSVSSKKLAVQQGIIYGFT